MDFLTMLIPAMVALLKAAPHLIEDAQNLAEALGSHPNETIRPGADHVRQAIENARSFENVQPPPE